VEVSRILIDTSAYAAHLSNHPEIKEELQRASEVCVSVVVLSELRAGFLKGSKRARNETLLREFLSSPRVRNLDMDEGPRSGMPPSTITCVVREHRFPRTTCGLRLRLHRMA